MWYLFIVIICFAQVTSTEVSHTRQHTVIDAFIERLQLETWQKEEAPCLEKTLTLLENVKNYTLWATWVWNANTIPMGNLYGSYVNFGNFDQCMKPPWLETHPEFKTKYCVAQFTLADKPKKKADYDPYGSTEEYLNSPTTSGLPVNFVRWGICVPAACGAPSIIKFSRAMYGLTTFGAPPSNVTVMSCQVAGENPQRGVGFYLFIALIITLMVTAAVSTYYRLHTVCEHYPSGSLETVITKSFCIIKNRQDLVKVNKDEIKVLNGMRFLSAATVIILHEMFYMSISGVINSRDHDKKIEGSRGVLLHLDVIIDTFFAMSGLLHIKGLLGNINRQQNLFSVLWKRYMRLIGPFALSIFYLASVSKYTGTGPFWIYGNELESEVCLKNWRFSLLMLNTDAKYICHGVTWYVPCDYQLAILGTVLFYFYQKDRRVGFAAFGIASVLSLVIPGFLTYWYQLPAVHFLDLSKIIRDIRNYWEISYTYTTSYSRAGAYLVGVAMGYLMTLYKPPNYRKTISKKIEGSRGVLLHLDVIIDTFFAMSGLLHIKGLLGNINRQQNLFSVLWKRYMRLIGPFALSIFYLASVSKYTGTGPFWIYGNELESEVCLKNWRFSLLMLNTDAKYICHGVTWYVPCDYQLAILGTVLFYFYQKDRRVGFAAFGIASVLSLVIPGFLTYWYQLPAVHFLDLSKIIRDIRNYWEISYTYTTSYSRAGAYLVGVAMGYLMTLYKPLNYRKTISKTWSIIGTATSLSVTLYVLSLGQYYMFREYNPVGAAIIASTNRIAWAVAICVIIGLCEYGTVPVVTDILSFSYFTPLSRLSYGIYMIHPLLIQRDKFTLRSPWRLDSFSIFLDTIGILTTSIGLSFAMWLLVEAPLINMSNHFLFSKSMKPQTIKEPEKNGKLHQNGSAKTKAA